MTEQQKTVNARYIFKYFRKKNWTKKSIAGLLANMEEESQFNPGLWQSRKKGNMSGGFGLVQWTPASKYINWAKKKGYPHEYIKGNKKHKKAKVMEGQLKRIEFEVNQKGSDQQWNPRLNKFKMTFKQFTQSKKKPSVLTEVFQYSYEKGGFASKNKRMKRADHWYNKFK